MFTSQHTFDYEEFFETTLKSITIPASVTEIWENAFSSNGLEKIVFKGTPIIKSSAF
ncbi:MAG: leucine-rich repeat domain-containing protein [Candidatus Peribacteria bacterium]|jgi:hypothetical protein|nr:leucine-rich repeat domain-containing protein [Candidatus Peribacteria bacterium]